MSPEEYAKLDRVDRDHWFYRGKRDIVRHWIGQYLTLQPDDLLVDAGCGTGAMLLEMSRVCRVVGFDRYDESIALARAKIRAAGGELLRASLEAAPLADGCASLALLLDVLEHLNQPEAALDEMIRIVRPGGLIVITVPALPWLWGDWDEALHHRRRYRRKDLLELAARPGVELLRCIYFNTAMLVPIACVRLWRRIFPPAKGKARAEDKLPAPLLNSLAHQCLVQPARWSWLRAPIGVSLLAVLRRMPCM